MQKIHIKSEKRVDHRVLASQSFGYVEIEPKRKSLIFAVTQKRSDNQVFENLKNHSTWPKSFCRNELGHPVEEAYKARPEGSVMLAHTAGRGQLKIQWGVFLPLEENSHVFITLIEGGEKDYEITLHGQFFMHAGRRGIHGFDQLHQVRDTDASTIINPLISKKGR